MKLTAVIEREGDGHASFCPELDIASQGDSIESARDNLREALEPFLNPLRRKKSRNGSVTRSYHTGGDNNWLSCASLSGKEVCAILNGFQPKTFSAVIAFSFEPRGILSIGD
jgi:predicted RNase H-like HicB family nuclease